VQAAEIDESPRPGEAPDAYVLRLAEGKARAAARLVEAGAVVIAADTTVADGDEILGKPADAAQAAQMLRQLRGRIHRVYTGLAVLSTPDGTLIPDLGMTEVPMRAYSDAEIEAYTAGGDPLDKAGAYAIQHAGFHPVERLEGCYANVVGLPLCHVARVLTRFGLPPQQNIPAGCRAALGYACAFYPNILG
jgi:MAF protein